MTDREAADMLVEDFVARFSALVEGVVEGTVGKVNAVFDETLGALRASHAREHDLITKMTMLAEHLGEHPDMRAVEVARWIVSVLKDHLERAQKAV